MNNEIVIVDRDNNEYLMTQDEAQAAVSTGAYFYKEGGAPMKKITNIAPMHGKKWAVKDKKTGKVFVMSSVDAKEAVKTGYFEFAEVPEKPAPKKQETKAPEQRKQPEQEEKPLQKIEAEAPKIEEEKQETAQFKSLADELPVLTTENTRRQIMQVLSQYNVPFQRTMREAELLDLWNEYRAAHA